jgi:hypothetical protein
MPHVGVLEVVLALGQIVLAWFTWQQRKDANQTRLRMQEVTAHSEAARRDDENMGSAINLASVMATNVQAQTTHFNALTAKLLGMDTTLTLVHAGVATLEEHIGTAHEVMAAATADRVQAQQDILETLKGVPKLTANEVEERLVGRFETLGNELAQVMTMSRDTSQVSQETNEKVRKLWGEWKELAPQLRAWLITREGGPDTASRTGRHAEESTDSTPPAAPASPGNTSESKCDTNKEP